MLFKLLWITLRTIHLFIEFVNHLVEEEVNFWTFLGRLKGGSGLFDNG